MNAEVVQEMAVGNSLIRVRSVRVDLPSKAGWVGLWEVYRLPWHRRKRAVHIGETEVDASESMALGMARAIAALTAVAFDVE
jgi:hypothetical protein